MDSTTSPPERGPHASAVKVVTEQWDDLVAAIAATTPLTRADAEDVVQDFALDLLKGQVVISTEPESWLAYIKRALKNRALNRHRDDARKAQRDEAIVAAEYELRHKDFLNEGIAARVMFLDAMTDLRRLPEHERETWFLRTWHEQTYAEIAMHLGLSIKQVDKRLQQATQRLARFRNEREEQGHYAALALVLHRVRPPAGESASVGSQLTAGMSSLAFLVALSMVSTSTGVSVPTTTPQGPARVASAATPFPAEVRPGSGPLTVRRFVGGRLAASGDPTPVPHSVLPTSVSVAPVCADHLCVSTSGNPVMPGDTLVITVAGHEAFATEEVAPVCEYVPTTTATRCERQEPANWIVKDVPPPPNNGGPLL